MDPITNQLVSSIISGLVGGVVTGIAAFAAIRVELKYLRRDVDLAHRRLNRLEGVPSEEWQGAP